MAKEFARYEVWYTRYLSDARTLLTTAADLETAQTYADKSAPLPAAVSIDYIALHDKGRTERFWVRTLEGVWKELGVAPLETTEPMVSQERYEKELESEV